MSCHLYGQACWRQIAGGVAVFLVAGLSYGQPQALRDPTTPPPEAQPSTTLDGQPGRVKGEPSTNTSIVIVREGQAAVVSGTRLYAPGEAIGQARIERITETDVWFREAGALRKVQRYAGVQIGPALPDCPAAAPAGAASAAAAPAKAKPDRARKPVSKPLRKPAAKPAPEPVPEYVPCFGGQPKATP